MSSGVRAQESSQEILVPVVKAAVNRLLSNGSLPDFLAASSLVKKAYEPKYDLAPATRDRLLEYGLVSKDGSLVPGLPEAIRAVYQLDKQGRIEPK